MMYKMIQDANDLFKFLDEAKTSGNTRHYMKRDGKNYILYVPAMGFAKEDLEIEFQDDILKINGTVKEDVPGFVKDNKINIEYEVKDFLVDDVNAKLENGILIINILAKKSDDSLNKKVEIV